MNPLAQEDPSAIEQQVIRRVRASVVSDREGGIGMHSRDAAETGEPHLSGVYEGALFRA